MKVYVAGKITGLSRKKTLRKFEKAHRELERLGHDVLVQTVLPELETFTHEDYMHVCFAMIDVCDAVYMLADWEDSKGARMELQYATEWKKKIMFEVKK